MNSMLNDLLELVWHFPGEWVTAALTLNLISIGVVVGLFIYLNQQTRQERFGLWMVSWMFYAIHLATLLALREGSNTLWLVFGERASIGVSALLMFWGSLQLTHAPRPHRELVAGIVLLVLWSVVAALRVGQSPWVTAPVFVLLAAANLYTGFIYLRSRDQRRAARLLGAGFSLWGLHLLTFPFLDWTGPTMTAAHLLATALTLFIAIGMLVEQEQFVSEQDYSALFQSASDALVLVDCNTLTVLQVNQATEQLDGRTTAELVGVPVGDLFPYLRDRVALTAASASAVAEAINLAEEWTWRRGDGGERRCQVHACLARCPRGRVLEINARDITAHQKMAADLRIRSAALEIADNCILLSDREGNVIWVNPAFTAMTGYTVAEAVGQKAWFLKDGADDALLRELYTSLHGEAPWRGEVTNRRKDGSRYRERMTITPVRDARGVLSNFVTVKEDLGRNAAGQAGS
jgi:PAS domain S-box-containing protein